MLEKSAKILNFVQAIAAALFVYAYFSSTHPGWLPFLVIFLALSVLGSAVLNLVFLRKKGPDIRGRVQGGYLDLRAFRIEATTNSPRWVNLPRGCSVKLYAELVNRNAVGGLFYPEKTSLQVRVGGERFQGNWERIIPGQQAIYEGRTESLNDLFDVLHPNTALSQGVQWNGYLGFFVDNFNRALLHDRTALKAKVKVRIHDTFGRIHTIKSNNVRLAIEEVCLPSEFAA
jgi:hypothetical protein